ncbi:MAG: SIMPL domain-containing protein, partial [Nocardioides sp.]
ALSGCASRLEAAVGVARRFTEPHRVASSGLHVDRAYDERGAESPTDWAAQHSLRIEVPDVAASGDLVTALADTVGNDLRIGHVEMYLADPGDLAVQARATAFAHARAKADELAALAGQRVVGVVGIAEGAAARPFGGREVALAAAATSFEPGSATVSAALTVTWTVEPD